MSKNDPTHPVPPAEDGPPRSMRSMPAIIRMERLLAAITTGCGIGKGTRKALRDEARKAIRHAPWFGDVAALYKEDHDAAERTHQIWNIEYNKETP